MTPFINITGAAVLPFERREPEPDFAVDRLNLSVVWRRNGLRIVHPEQFACLADLFIENGWKRHFNALYDAELALSEVVPVDVVRGMLASCPEVGS